MENRGGQRGQVAILFALVFTFMFVLFAFVVDFGHLINLKINLQNAADAAAYAGASWQAEALNRLGMINFHIRQDVKELAMRSLVTHLRHNRDFPRGTQFINGGHQAHRTEPFMCQQAHGYVARSGLRYAADTNLCRNASPSTGGLPPIVVPPVIAGFDPFAVALQQQIRRIADAANQQCRAAADDNRVLVEHLIRTYTRRSQFHENQMRQIANWLNEAGGGQLDENETHPIRKVAYESARRNLAQANRDGLEVTIIPPANNEYIRLETHRLNGTLLYFDFNVVGDGCIGRPKSTDFNEMISVVTKTPEIVTFFVVKLSARPQMLFMPQAWIDSAFPKIEAYATAKPFGSRIGPDAQFDNLTPTVGRANNGNKLMNFSVYPNDGIGMMSTKLMALLDAVHPFNRIPRPDGNQQTGWPDAAQGKPANVRLPLRYMQAPTIFEAMFYTAYPNPNQPDQYEEPQYAEAIYPDYLESADVNGNIIQTRQPSTAAYFPEGVGSKNRGQGWIQIDATGSAQGGEYNGYGDEAPFSHSMMTAVGLPFVNQGNARAFGFATKEMVHSGWAPPNRPRRIGYSVKFIGLDAIMGKLFVKLSNGAQGRIANAPEGDPNLSRIIH